MQELENKLLEYLNGNLDEKGVREIEDWVGLSKENQETLDQVRRIYQYSESDRSYEPDVESAWQKISAHINKPKAKQVYMDMKAWYRAAAVIVLGVGIGVLTYLSQSRELTTVTAYNKVVDVRLPDGTLIYLNKGAEVQFDEEFDQTERTVYLDGQAYFDVHRDIKRPFEVVGPSATVRVLGTSFDFKSDENSSNVNVNSGTVAFVDKEDEDNKVILEKGEQGTLANKEIEKVDGLNTEAMAWRYEELVFKSTPLIEVIVTLEKFYNVKIQADDNIKSCLISSSFKDKSLEEILTILEAIAEIKSTEEEGVLKMTGPGC